MTDLSQDQQVGKLATPLGGDTLVLVRLTANEGMGELFEFRIEALSEDPAIDFDKALGLNSSVHLDTSDGAGRDYSGVLTEARKLGQKGRFFAYSLVLRPWLWLLSLTSDCRIFANMDVKDIIKQVFKDRGFSDVLDLMTHDYPTLEYTVQYRETDLNFVLRLMEEYGIYYYFQFEQGDGSTPSIHYLVLADSSSHVPLPNLTELQFLPSTVSTRRDVQQVNDWTTSHAVVSGIFALKDYNYEKSKSAMLASAQFAYQFTHGDMEVYNYPGDYEDRDEGVELATVSRDAERTRNKRNAGSGYAPSLTPGYTVQRTSTDGDADDNNYLILRCSHVYGNQSYETGAAGGNAADYYGTFEFAQSDIPFRMPQHTRKPVVVGSQSALVIGKKGEEIDVDKEGRILVQFYWDRKNDSSRRVRVAQFWAGLNRGALFLPRIGDEVLIQYEEGNPDRPVCIGSVYNDVNPMTKPMPDQKTHSGILTKSSKNSDGYSFILFDDTAGSERLKIRAQRDLMVKALRNETWQINGSQSESIGGDVNKSVGGDETIKVGTVKSGGNYALTAEKTITLTVGASSITMTKTDITIKAPMIYLNP